MAAEKTTATTQPSAAQSAEKIDRIRDIVFGGQMRDYTQRFEMLGTDLTRAQQEINSLQEAQRAQEANFLRQLQQRADELSAQLTDQVTRQTQQLQDLERRVVRSVQELEQKLLRSQEEFDRMVRAGEEALRNEYRQSSAALNQNKMDRFSLGDLLTELGQNLKSDTPAPMTAMAGLLEQFEAELGTTLPTDAQG